MHCSALQCVVVCCNVLQCDAVYCSVLQCVVVHCSALQCVVVCCNVFRCVAVHCSALQCVAVSCSMLQYIVVCCSVLQCVARALSDVHRFVASPPSPHCNTLLIMAERFEEKIMRWRILKPYFEMHVWHMCLTHEWVTSRTWVLRVTHMNESWHTYEWVMSHIWVSHVTHMNESCHTYKWVMSHTWMSHVTHMNTSHTSACNDKSWSSIEKDYLHCVIFLELQHTRKKTYIFTIFLALPERLQSVRDLTYFGQKIYEEYVIFLFLPQKLQSVRNYFVLRSVCDFLSWA